MIKEAINIENYLEHLNKKDGWKISDSWKPNKTNMEQQKTSQIITIERAGCKCLV